jgi:hypothetical protein
VREGGARVTIDIMRFCAPQGTSRFAIETPYVKYGWIYATTGRIAVRVPDVSESPPADACIPSLRQFDGYPFGLCTEPWPAPDGLMVTTTAKCACASVCDCTDGVCTCGECGQGHTCELCDGTGRRATPGCPVCEGDGCTYVQVLAPQLVAGRWIAHPHWELITSLAGVRYEPEAPLDTVRHSEVRLPLAFVADGGVQGLVTSIDPRRVDEIRSSGRIGEVLA